MVFVTEHDPARTFKLLGDLLLVTVIEAVPLMALPDTYRYGKSESEHLVKQIIDVVRIPRANRVGTSGRQLFEGGISAGTAYEIRLTATQQLPALLRLTQLSRDGFG